MDGRNSVVWHRLRAEFTAAKSRTARIVGISFLEFGDLDNFPSSCPGHLPHHAFTGDHTWEWLTFLPANLEIAPDGLDQTEEMARWGGFEPPTS